MEYSLEDITLKGQLEPVHPGILLGRSVFPNIGLSRQAIEQKLELSDGQFSDLLAGKADVTESIANRLNELVGGGAAVWLRHQHMFNLWRVPHRAPQI